MAPGPGVMLLATPLALAYAIRCLPAAPDRGLAIGAFVIALAEAVVVGSRVFALLFP